MNIFENENSLNNNLYKINQKNSNNLFSFNSKFIHKILDSINFSFIILIFILSFLSLNSQRNWTNIYRNLAKTRSNNNNLLDYISRTEQFYINEIESLNILKKTTPNDLIYLDKQIPKKKKNKLIKFIKYIRDGLKDSKYQKVY